jgi:hypothetical protein
MSAISTRVAIALLLCANLVPLRVLAEDQPHMRAAMEHIRQAQQQLDQAASDKGGHRIKALEHLKAAMAEVEAGIQYANTHPEKRHVKRP